MSSAVKFFSLKTCAVYLTSENITIAGDLDCSKTDLLLFVLYTFTAVKKASLRKKKHG
jgi:hypothetical protein